MGVQFEHPWFLLLLLPWVAMLWWMYRSTLRLTGARKQAAIGVRAVAVLLIIMVASGISPYWIQSQREVVFVADRSASLQADKALGGWIAEAVSGKDEDDRAAVVSFGLDALVEQSLSKGSETERGAEAFPFRTSINPNYSNLSQGLQLASGMLEAEGGRVVLLSDGEENVGNLLRQGRLLRDRGIIVDVLPVAPPERKDAAIERLDVPKSLKQAEKFTFEITVASTFAGEAELRLYEDNRELVKQQVMLERGDNRFMLQSIAAGTGFHRYRAELFAAGDEQAENNSGYAYSRVSGPPTVLVVEGKPDDSGNIAAALEASHIRTEIIQPEQLPRELANYSRYDSIILNNVPATRIAAAPMEWLSKAVSDYGIGLVSIGGEDSYGLGGYFKTPVERALPVYMELKGKRQIPSLGLILVIDKSGSMSGGKIELAKEAAIRTVELMREQDTVGVIAFDGTPWWVVEPTKLSDKESVMNDILGIQATGGTEIYSSLDLAYREMLELTTERKHIILLTDGQSASNPGYSSLTQSMTDNQMTLSTVAIGNDADTNLLRSLAEAAKGRYYFTNDESTLPAIFSREAVLMSRTYIVNQPFIPAIGQAGEWGADFGGGVPEIQAYVATTVKETAESVLLSPDGDPLLARWQYGSGRAVAWTSDLTGKWSRNWVEWSKFPELFAKWVKWTFPQFASDPYNVTASIEGSEAKLQISGADSEMSGTSGLKVDVTDEKGQTQQISAIPTSPGEYEVRLPAAGPGAYVARIAPRAAGDAREQGAEGEGTLAGFVIPYSQEYRIAKGDGIAKLEQLAALTGGRVLTADHAAEVFRADKISVREYIDVTRLLLIVALLLWLADIAIRRVSLQWSQIASAAAVLKRRIWSPSRTQASEGTASVTRLAQRKSRVDTFYGKGKEASNGRKADPRSGPFRNEARREQSTDDSFGRQEKRTASERPASENKGGANSGDRRKQAQEQAPAASSAAPAGSTAVASAAASAGPETADSTNNGSTSINRLLAAKNRTRR